MRPTNDTMERRLRIASILVLIGLIIQLTTLFWNHPLAFMAFIVVGSPLVLVGIAFYLISIVSKSA